jgi:hypothetical protein
MLHQKVNQRAATWPEAYTAVSQSITRLWLRIVLRLHAASALLVVLTCVSLATRPPVRRGLCLVDSIELITTRSFVSRRSWRAHRTARQRRLCTGSCAHAYCKLSQRSELSDELLRSETAVVVICWVCGWSVHNEGLDFLVT